MNRWVYDIECYPNYFSAAFESYDTDERKLFEIYEGVDDSLELIKFLKSINYLIGFNSIAYDNLLLVSIIKGKRTNKDLYQLTYDLIEARHGDTKEEQDEGRHIIGKPYKYFPREYKLKSIDLYLYWSKMLRLSKMLSLKSLACQLNFHNIQELPFKPGTVLTKDQIDIVREYNFNDVEVTKLLARRMSDDINLRVNIEKEYGVNCISRDSVNMGSDIFLKLYSEKIKSDLKEVKALRTKRSYVDLSKVIFKNITFKHGSEEFYVKDNRTYCKSFYGLLKLLKTKRVYSTNELNYTVIYNGVKFDFGSGGIHAIDNNTIHKSDDNIQIVDADVGSYYPAIICNYNLHPKHLGIDWTELYNKLRVERIAAKKTDPLKASVYKLILNGSYGLLNNQYSWLYDWKVTLAITINGQLMLVMLAERLSESGINVYTLNTDGLTAEVPRDKLGLYYSICKQWEEETKMVLEYEEYDKTIMKNVNNYIWIKGDKSKTKGLFVTNPVLGNSTDFLVIPKALEAYFVNGIQPEKFIKEHNNIFDFCAAKKVAKSFQVIWMNEIQQQLNRYYVSKRGAYLYKQKERANPENVLKGYGVMLYNKHEEKPMENYHIDYQYYINKVREIINDLEPKQMTLF